MNTRKNVRDCLLPLKIQTYKQENTIHLAGNVTIGYGLNLLKGDDIKTILGDYLPDNSKKLKVDDKELTFYEIIQKYRAGEKDFTDANTIKDYLKDKVFNFSLTQEQAQKVLENMIPTYKKRLSEITTYYLPYSKERASLLSMQYLGKAIKNNGLIKAIIRNSRFLSWFIIRYKTNINTYLGYIARSCDESDIYLSNPNINKIKLMFDIFSYLNIKKENIQYRKYQLNKTTKDFTVQTKETRF